MEGSWSAAAIAALDEADRTTVLANNFVHDISSSNEELEPVLVELFGLGSLLKQLQDVDVPGRLQPPVTRVIWACSDICRYLGAVLSGCGDDTLRSRRWALTDAPAEVEGLKANLQNCIRTLEIVAEALKVDNGAQIVNDIDDLQKDLTPDLTQLDAMLVDCLETVESIVTGHGDGDGDGAHRLSGHATLASPPRTSIIHEIITSLDHSSLRSSTSKDPVLHAVEESEYQFTPGSLGTSPLAAIVDDDIFPRHKIYSDSPRSPDPRERQKKRRQGSLPSPNPLLSPPAYPPPARALPPLPPPKSPMRSGSILSTPPTSPPSFSSRPPSIPIRSRERAFSDAIRDSKFSTLSLGTTSRFSGSSQASSTNLSPRPTSYNYPGSHTSLVPDTVSEEKVQSFEIVASRRLENEEKDTSQGGVYSIETSPASTCLASRHGKFHIKLWDLPAGPMFTTIKVPFYVQVQPRSREFFIRSHAILSETLNLIAIATGFGQTLEIWNWAKRKKVQTISHANRWTAVRAELQDETHPFPLAAYREDEDTISLYPASATSSAKKPFGKPRVIDLRKAGLPHLPKLPELAYSATGPLLVAAAGPRPPRPGAPPPAHAALLMAWQLDNYHDDEQQQQHQHHHRPYKLLQTSAARHPELENALPLCLATYGSVAVSIWEPARFRTIGRPGAWQVEPVAGEDGAGGGAPQPPPRVVLVWDFSRADKVTTYRIPHVPLSCVSPDCRFVAYCDPGGGAAGDGPGGAAGALVVLDATQGGRELWRLDGEAGKSCRRRSGKSSDARRGSGGASSSRSDDSSLALGGAGLEALAARLHKVTELAFSGDGKSLFVGDIDGGVGVYELREGSGIGIAV